MVDQKLRVVVIGGGTGCPTVLRALRSYNVDLTAIVTVFDSGGSTGRLREELGLPALGDIRRCLGALASHNLLHAGLAESFEHRFPGENGVGGHTLGNLALAALYQQAGGLEQAVERLAALLDAQGTVLPVSLSHAHLCAELSNGFVITTEADIDKLSEHTPAITRVFLEPAAHVNPRAVEALKRADLIILGPGDLYTSVLPNLLVDGIPQAINAAHGKVMYICNVTNRIGQTTGYSVSKYAHEVLRYLGKKKLDYLLANNALVHHGGAVPVDGPECEALAEHVVLQKLAATDGHRHDESALGRTIWSLLHTS